MLLIEAELKPSAIEGLGLFTKEKVYAGQKVWEFCPLVDIEYRIEDLSKLPKAFNAFLRRYGYLSVEDNKWVLNADLSRHMNHSESPTLVSDDNSNYYAITDLPEGTELTCDYREFAKEGCNDFLNE